MVDERLRFVAFELPSESDRAEVRRLFIELLAREGLLSGRYFGPPPDPSPAPPAEVEGWLTGALARLVPLTRDGV